MKSDRSMTTLQTDFTGYSDVTCALVRFLSGFTALDWVVVSLIVRLSDVCSTRTFFR